MKLRSPLWITAIIFSSLATTLIGHLAHRGYIARLEERAAAADTVCTFAKITLRNDARIIESEPASSRLRADIIGRIYGTNAGDDANTMDACMPQPFDRARWRECRTAGDQPCIVSMLIAAMNSIDTGAER